jgi:hypothetical protein
MLTRRALIGTGLSAAGSAGAGAVGDGEAAVEAQTSVIDPRQLAEIIAKLDVIGDELERANNGCFAGTCPIGDRIREAMVPFLRASNKYPDFVEVGYGVFHAMYDWHVRNRLQVNVTRAPDGRYALGYLFSRLILRPDAQPDFIGVPYDARP